MSKFGKCPICKTGPDVLLIGGVCSYHFGQRTTSQADKLKALKEQFKGEPPGNIVPPPPKGLTKIKRVSEKEKERQKQWKKVRIAKLRADPICQHPHCAKRATEVHHGKGRIGKLLTDPRWLLSLCNNHHRWAELNPEEAKKIGLSFSRLSKEG